MRRKDFLLLGALAALILAMLAPAGIRPGFVPANFGDLYAYHYPMRHLIASSLEAGRLPFWNPYIFSGLPLAANPQSAVFYPLSILGTVLPLSAALSWDFVFHLLWAACGWSLLARKQGLGTLGALLLAACYCLSPFIVYRISEGIPTLLASLSWAPWCWLAWLCAGAPMLAAVWSLQFFSGHPQFMVINAAAMAVWGLLHPRRAPLLGRMAAAGLATLAMTALEWLPLREFLAHSVRRGWPQSYTTAYSMDAAMALNSLYPDAWGNPLDGTYAGPPSVFFETAGVFVGILALALAGYALWNGRRKSAALIALGMFLAAGGHNALYVALLDGPLGWLRTPSRYSFLCLWGFLLAAAAGWMLLQARFKPAALLKAAAVAAAILELAAWDRRFLGAADSRPYLAPNAAVAARIAGRPWRVMTDPDLASPNKTMLYRAMNVNGYEAFYLSGYPEYAARSEGRAAADASRTYLRRYDSPEMNRLGVRYFLSAAGALKENSAALPLAYFVDDRGSPLASDATVSIESPEHWKIEGALPAKARAIVAGVPLYPGWTARLDGENATLERWDGWLAKAPVPAGGRPGRRLVLRLDFIPTGWPRLAALSALSWAAWLLLGARRAARELRA
ncbi:MAG: hypothetical protein HY077_01740 [Elusimicrobia bacterium]|nr:hypothetical protein [Elusimicrobiota bacterium]